jgi:hypothetical protein
MNPTMQTAATAYVAPKILKNFKFRWIFYGAAVYYGLRVLKRRGYNVDSALNLIDHGVDYAKKNFGLSSHRDIGGQNLQPTH